MVGEWQMQITSSSAHSIRVTGLSRLTFRHGFSSILIPDLTRTRRQPIQGASTYLTIEISEKDDIQSAKQVELVDLYGNVLVNKDIQANDNYSTLYSTLDKFQPPASSFFFYIRVFFS
jgi:hypothetical protein